MLPEDQKVASIGGFAKTMIEPVDFLGNFMNTCALVIGIFCLLLGVMKYLDYRRNSYTTTMGSVLSFILPGIILIILSFFHY